MLQRNKMNNPLPAVVARKGIVVSDEWSVSNQNVMRSMKRMPCLWAVGSSL